MNPRREPPPETKGTEMISTPEAGTIAARVLDAQRKLDEARREFLAFDIALDATEHEAAAVSLRLAYDAAREFTRETRAVLEEINNLLEWEAPLGVWVWACLDPKASPVVGRRADSFAGAYVRHFATDSEARRWLASPERDTYRVGEEAAPLFLVNHGEITAVWGVDE